MSTDGLPLPLAAEVDFLAGRVDCWLEQSDRVSAAISARSLVLRGRLAEASDALAGIAVDELEDHDLSAAAWATSRVGGPLIEPLLVRLAEHSALFIGGDAPAGPVSMFSGMLRASSGDIEGAADELRVAVSLGDTRAPLWGALARLELASVLRTAESIPIESGAPARSTLQAARTFFAAGGYRSLLERCAAADGPTMAVLDVAGPCIVGFGVEANAAIRFSKGLLALRYMLDHSDRVVTARELSLVLDGEDPTEIAALAPAVWRDRSADPAAGDVAAQLRAVFFDDGTRSRVSKLIRRTIDKVGTVHRAAGLHLSSAITTGHGCRYEPVGHPVVWRSDCSSDCSSASSV